MVNCPGAGSHIPKASSSLYPGTHKLVWFWSLKGIYPKKISHKLSENRFSGVHSGYHSLHFKGGSDRDTWVIPIWYPGDTRGNFWYLPNNGSTSSVHRVERPFGTKRDMEWRVCPSWWITLLGTKKFSEQEKRTLKTVSRIIIWVLLTNKSGWLGTLVARNLWKWGKGVFFLSSSLRIHGFQAPTRGVCHTCVALPFLHFKVGMLSKAKEELWKAQIFHHTRI
jgi:hypothetical protein